MTCHGMSSAVWRLRSYLGDQGQNCIGTVMQYIISDKVVTHDTATRISLRWFVLSFGWIVQTNYLNQFMQFAAEYKIQNRMGY